MKTIAVLALFCLAACGADAPPTKPGVTVTGDARIGVTNNIVAN